SEKTEKLVNFSLSPQTCGNPLLDEQCLAKLIPANKGLAGTEPAEELLNLSILIHTLNRAQWRGGNHLQGVRIRDSVSLKNFGLLAGKHREHEAPGPQQFSQTSHCLFGNRGLQIIQNVP